MSGMDLDDELLRAAGRKQSSARKQKRARKDSSESEEEVSEEEELELSDDDDAPAKLGRGGDVPPPPPPEDAEGLDDDDDERLAAMTELEREMVLAERAERQQQAQQRRALLAQTPPSSTPGSKATRARARGTEAEEEGGRAMRSGRELREESAKKSAMQELLAAREKKAKDAAHRQRAASPGASSDDEAEAKRSGKEYAPDEEEEEVSEEEEAYASLSPSSNIEHPAEEEEEATFEELKNITIRRHRLEAWVDEPFLDRLLPGCLVRVTLGERTLSSGERATAYALALVMGVERRPPGTYKDCGQPWKCPYPLPAGPDGRPRTTDLWLRVARGWSERLWPIALVSNQAPTPAEADKLARTMAEENRPVISASDASAARRRLEQAEGYTYTAEDLAAVVARRRAQRAAPANLAAERARLTRARDAASETGDARRLEEIERQIAGLGTEDGRAAAPTKDLAALNARNKQINFENALHNVSNKFGGAGESAAGAVEPESGPVLDPFSRRATRPQVYWSTRQRIEDAKRGASEGEAVEEGAPERQENEAGVDGAWEGDGEASSDLFDWEGLDLRAMQAVADQPLLACALLGDDAQRALRRRMAAPLASGEVSLEQYRGRVAG